MSTETPLPKVGHITKVARHAATLLSGTRVTVTIWDDEGGKATYVVKTYGSSITQATKDADAGALRNLIAMREAREEN